MAYFHKILKTKLYLCENLEADMYVTSRCIKRHFDSELKIVLFATVHCSIFQSGRMGYFTQSSCQT
jgi:hypothetical protein